MGTRISYYAETAPRGDDEVVLERQRRLAGAALSRARAGDMGRLYPRNPDDTPRENAEEPFVTPQRSTREMSIRAVAPNMGPFTRLVCTNFRTLHTKYAPGPLLPTTDGRSTGGADINM